MTTGTSRLGTPNQRLASTGEICGQGEMLRIQNHHVDGQHEIAIPGEHTKDGENRRIGSICARACAPTSSAARPLGRAPMCLAPPRENSRRASRRPGDSCPHDLSGLAPRNGGAESQAGFGRLWVRTVLCRSELRTQPSSSKRGP